MVWFECIKCKDVIIKIIEKTHGTENFFCGQYYTMFSGGGGGNSKNGYDFYNQISYKEAVKRIGKRFNSYFKDVIEYDWV